MRGRTLTDHYSDYYAEGPSAWRETGAVERVDRIVAAWKAVADDGRPSVLDIGCGEGAIGAELHRRDFPSRYVGLEVSESGVAAAKTRRADLDFRVFDGQRLPFEDDEFDVAVLSHVVEHLEAPRQLLREAGRVAKRVYVEVPLELHWRTPKNFRWTDVGHVNLYNPLLIRHLVQSTGFKVVYERVANNRLALSQYRYGTYKGTARWLAREVALRAVPALASRVFTLDAVLMAERGS